jgi:hypothetical protein
MLFKKDKPGRGKCPFQGFKPCRDDCVFYRRGIRYFEDKNKEPEEVEDCAMNMAVDNLEQMHNRIFTLQKEMGETKNVMGYKVLHELGALTENKAVEQVVRTLLNGEDYADGPTLIEGPKSIEGDYDEYE